MIGDGAMMVPLDTATDTGRNRSGELLASPAWWAGLRLDERRVRPLPRAAEALARGSRRLSAWQNDRTVTGGLEPDLSRWYDSGIEEEELLLLLGETPDNLRDRTPAVPQWLTSIVQAWSADPAERRALDDDVVGEFGPSAGFLALVHPLSSWYQAQLHAKINVLARRHGHQEDLPRDHALLRPNHASHISMVTAVLAVHLRLASRDGVLVGDTPSARFTDFTRRLEDPAFALRILARYPTLARELVEELEKWSAVRLELAERTLTDLSALGVTFGVACRSLHDIVDVQMGAGDTHRGGRSVAILTFGDGGKVVYKPRGLAVECHFYTLVDLLNSAGLTHPLRQLGILNRDDYGWVEFVSTEGCSSEDELRRFFWRQGAYLSLLYLLRGSDIHLENVIAAGEQPIIVDLEALFQQVLPVSDELPMGLPREAMRLSEESVLSIGLLPQRVLRQDGDSVTSTELSGMAGGAGELTPMAVPRWHEAGTDQMRRTRARAVMPDAQNRAVLDGAAVDPAAYRSDLVAGFESCYRLLLSLRSELAAADGPIAAFAADEIRVIVQPTMVYARILQECWHPRVLRDALDRQCLFEVVGSRHPDLVANVAVATSEVWQLTQGDIPFFWTRPNSRDLHDERGVLVPGFFPRSGLTLVEERLATLSPDDLRRQSWAVTASMAAMQIGDKPRDPEPRVRPLPADVIDESLAYRAAVRIGDRLLSTAVGGGADRPMWLTLNIMADRYWNVVPTGYESFNGLCGIAIFLGQLGAQTGLPRFRSAAESIATMLTEHVDSMLDWREQDRDMLGLGGFSDLGGYVHALTHLGALWQSEPLLAQARRLTPEVLRRIAEDQILDVLTGTAGAALALRGLHAVDPTDQTRAALEVAGDRLLATAESSVGGLSWRTSVDAREPLLGFSHGVSGIAYTLAEIGRVTGARRFLDAAGRAVRYEHRRYDGTAGNWPDHRDITPVGAFMNAWCHGAAGIGLARAAMLDSVDVPEVRMDLDAAVATVRRDLLPDDRLTGTGNDCLCHGDLGLVEVLFSAGRRTGDSTLVSLAGRAARSAAEIVLAGEERTGVPLGLHVPGLLMGAAGIGYGLLRAARPDLAPNVLLLEPPTAARSPRPGVVAPVGADTEEAACHAYR
ncbi:type 2 lanthipeptide synthetase LanM family protein [Micromonospora sp. NPDC049230]|uniref:type 2 lanthipeptide synthetase LanM family protein n=1 Tax=Micromonospora sp. NPDC049230 TaxID=3155502 RepID=UPI0033EC8AE6